MRTGDGEIHSDVEGYRGWIQKFGAVSTPLCIMMVTDDHVTRDAACAAHILLRRSKKPTAKKYKYGACTSVASGGFLLLHASY